MFQRELKLAIEIPANAFLNVEERTLSIEVNLLFFRSTSEGEGFPSSEMLCTSPAGYSQKVVA